MTKQIETIIELSLSVANNDSYNMVIRQKEYRHAEYLIKYLKLNKEKQLDETYRKLFYMGFE